MSVPLLRRDQFWECPNCPAVDKTNDPRANPFHRCRGLAGLTAPLVPAGTRCQVTAHEREDYIAAELVPLHEGRPVAQVRTTRDDGQDCLVLAPTARVRVS
jgi:hypothetical protein